MSEIARQVRYGLAKGADAAVTHWLNQLSFSMAPRSEYVTNNSAFGVLEKTNSSQVLRQWAEGTLEHKLTSDSSGLVLLGAFGSVATTDNADTNAAVKDHTFSINQNIDGQLFTLYRDDALKTEKFTAARFGEWSLNMALDDYITFTARIMGRKGTTTTATPASTDETEFVPKYITVKTATTEGGLGAATAISAVESFTLTVNPNIEADWEAGNNAPYGFSSRGYDLSFEMTCRYNNTTYEDAYNNGTQLALQVSAINTDVLIGAAARPSLVVTAPKMYITDWTRNEDDLDAPITQTMTGTIHYSSADARAIRAVLTNVTSSY